MDISNPKNPLVMGYPIATFSFSDNLIWSENQSETLCEFVLSDPTLRSLLEPSLDPALRSSYILNSDIPSTLLDKLGFSGLNDNTTNFSGDRVKDIVREKVKERLVDVHADIAAITDDQGRKSGVDGASKAPLRFSTQTGESSKAQMPASVYQNVETPFKQEDQGRFTSTSSLKFMDPQGKAPRHTTEPPTAIKQEPSAKSSHAPSDVVHRGMMALLKASGRSIKEEDIPSAYSSRDSSTVPSQKQAQAPAQTQDRKGKGKQFKTEGESESGSSYPAQRSLESLKEHKNMLQVYVEAVEEEKALDKEIEELTREFNMLL